MIKGEDRIYDPRNPDANESFHDLDKVVLELKGKSEFRRVVGILESFKHVLSCHRDLEGCQRALKLLAQEDERARLAMSDGGTPDADASARGEALLVMALVKYTRATSTKAESGRRNVFGMEWLSDEQKTRHDRIKASRNESIVHYGEGDVGYSLPWQASRLLFGSHDGSFHLDMVKVNYSFELIDDLNDLSNHVMSHLKRKVNELANELFVEVSTPTRSDFFRSLISKYSTNLKGRPAYYGPDEIPESLRYTR